jgi:site-specific DNA-cytosine methylase
VGDRVYKSLHLFCGLGGNAIGFQRARSAFGGLEGRFRTLAGIDNDPAACADFERLTGAPALCGDVSAMTPAQLLEVTNGEAPDVIFTSPPCKGFSGLLSNASAKSEKYQKLNALVFQGLWLVLETWPKNPPKLIVLENVPRIATRGADLLLKLRSLLSSYGYRFHEGFHDCGEVGGLAQHRNRFLMVARHEAQVPNFVYQPPKKRVRSVGEVLASLPMPDHPNGGPMHRVPRLNWKTWVRLALIPAGGDWRALGRKSDGPWSGRGTFGIVPWESTLGTVTSNGRPGAGAFSVADPRIEATGYNNKFRVVRWEDPSVAVTGGGTPTSGGVCIADPRPAVGGAARDNLWRVDRWEEPSRCVTGAASPSTGALSIADPRFSFKDSRPGLFGVLPWDKPSGTINGQAQVTSSNCPAAVADPRIPADDDRPDPPPVIVSLDGTWHRPLTTLELAVLQGLPVIDEHGRGITLAGNSHTDWRERIGNAVPPPAAQAVGESLLHALLAADSGATFTLGGTGIWVRQEEAVAHG